MIDDEEDLIAVSERLRGRMLALADELDRWIDAVRREDERHRAHERTEDES